jgi:cytochrome c553
MMRKTLKWAAVVLSAVSAIILVAGTAFYIRGGSRLAHTFDVEVSDMSVSVDSSAVARGRHLAGAVTLCHACHGDRLEGDLLFEAPGIATVYASNLTAGMGGAGATYGDAELARAIRHGINRDGRGILVMHADAYNHLGEADLAALIAYIRSVPPVDNELPGRSVTALGRIMIGLGLFDTESMPLIPAEVIDHDAPPPSVPAVGVTAEYGGYLTTIALCAMCHGREFTGGPPIDDGAPPGPAIAAYAMEGGWPEEDFLNTMRTGVTPYGKTLDEEYMPWPVYARMTDEEIMAVWTYLRSRSR